MRMYASASITLSNNLGIFMGEARHVWLKIFDRYPALEFFNVYIHYRLLKFYQPSFMCASSNNSLKINARNVR